MNEFCGVIVGRYCAMFHTLSQAAYTLQVSSYGADWRVTRGRGPRAVVLACRDWYAAYGEVN